MFVPKGHDCSGEGDSGDGVEVGELGEHEVYRSKDHDEVCFFDGFAAWADGVVELLERCSSGDHVDDAHPHLDDQLLGHHDPQAKLLTKCVLPELVVSVESLAWDHLVHLHHLP